jgi:hypothetical protein
MTYDPEAVIEFELERLRFKRQRYSERKRSSQTVLPAIQMIIGDGTSTSSACRRGRSPRANRKDLRRPSAALNCWGRNGNHRVVAAVAADLIAFSLFYW